MFRSPSYIILLTKLRDILEDFLVGRSMRVKVGDVFSTIKFICYLGYPMQGSVLPLLFSLFDNDLPDEVMNKQSPV